jgi:legumain
MSFNDVITANWNKFSNQLFNKPTYAEPGVDVNEGCVIDYEGDDVTKENFMAVLKGDSEATGGKKVLKTTSEDRIFINYVDHGAVGLVAFPHAQSFTSEELLETFDYMHQNQLYDKIVFYLEACESGSML